MSSSDQTGVVFSGRKATPVIVSILLLLCLSIAYFVAMVQRLQVKREATAEQWRNLAVLLDRDYRRLEQQWREAAEQTSPVAAKPTAEAPSPVLDEPSGSLRHFQKKMDEFRTTVDLANQRQSADQIEEFLSAKNAEIPVAVSASASLRESTQEYNSRLGDERDVLTSIGGRLVRFFLVVPELPDFQLGR